MPGIIINPGNLAAELQFTDYHQMRGQGRDKLRFGVYPNAVALLNWVDAFDATYAPGGTEYDPEIWAHHTALMEPIAAHYDTAIAALRTFVQLVEGVEQAAPGTFGIELPQTEVQE